MKKILSFTLLLVLVLGLSTQSFANKPSWSAKGRSNGMPPGLEKRDELPNGLKNKENLPLGLRKYTEDKITSEDINELIEEVNEYISENELNDLDIVDSIDNLIKRIEGELLKEEPELNRLYNNLKSKYEMLKKANNEEVNYLNKLKDLKEDLEEVESSESLEDLIDDINLYIELGEVSEEKYQDFKELAKEFIDIDSEEKDLDELVIEVREFISHNDFGTEIGEYSDDKVFELLELVLSYNPEDDEADLDDLYEEISEKYNDLKLSKIVGEEYIENLKEYKNNLEDLIDDADKEKTDKLNDLIDNIEEVLDEKKITLKKYNELKKDYVNLTTDFQEYKDELNDLIEEAKDLLDEVYDESAIDERKTLINRLTNIMVLSDEYEDKDEYLEAISLLEESIEDYEKVLD